MARQVRDGGVGNGLVSLFIVLIQVSRHDELDFSSVILRYSEVVYRSTK